MDIISTKSFPVIKLFWMQQLPHQNDRTRTRENSISSFAHLDVEGDGVAENDAAGLVVLGESAHDVGARGSTSGEDTLVEDGLFASGSGGALDVTVLAEVTLGGVNSDAVELLQ